MKTSSDGIELIKRFEGLRLTAYRDPAGVWTIGHGHTTAAGTPVVAPGLTIDAAEAAAILERDLGRFEEAVARLVAVPLPQAAFDALVSLAYNIGEAAFAGSTLLKRLNAGDRPAAAREFARWTRAGGRVLPGLAARRAAEQALFLAGEGAAGSAAPALPAIPAAPTIRALLPAAAGRLLRGLFGFLLRR